MNKVIRNICDMFRINGRIVNWEEIKNGNIHHTYKVNVENSVEERSYILQNMNTLVFKNPRQVMENIDAVSAYIRRTYPDKTTLHFHHTETGMNYFEDEHGFWRLMDYIPSITCNGCDNLEMIHYAGIAFGEFQMMLSDFNAAVLHETIPDFHNTKKRYEKFRADISADSCHKVHMVEDEIQYLLSVQKLACQLTDMQEHGQLPLRVTHNDTKINNVLFDKISRKAIAVIDLDTVMPGLVGHDFGDAVRFAANYVEEDSQDYSSAGLNLEVFKAFTEGFLLYTGKTLTSDEIQTLSLSCFAITTEQAVRFLGDYICGDKYYKIVYPEHNLVRARCQIALAKDIYNKLDVMNLIIKHYYK